MSMKSNRRVYVASTLARVYCYKVEDGKVIQRINIEDGNSNKEELIESDIKFIYYHELTKMLLVIL